jgi:hypothetical protein
MRTRFLSRLGNLNGTRAACFVSSMVRAAGTTNVEPSVKGQRKAHQGNQGREYWNDKEQDPADERTDPKGCISLPEEWSRAIERLCGRREGQVIRNAPERRDRRCLRRAQLPIKRPWRLELQLDIRGPFLPDRRNSCEDAGNAMFLLVRLSLHVDPNFPVYGFG